MADAPNSPLPPANGQPPRENWGSRIGVILAVAGSAVGLGNFLRFPGQAYSYGGGIFMIPYFISLLIVGIPICWAEWTMGRFGGTMGHNSAPGIFRAMWPKNPYAKYIGVLALIIPVIIYMYYVYIEVWCLAYTIDYARGAMTAVGRGLGPGQDVKAYGDHFSSMVGMAKDGWPGAELIGLVVVTFLLNFFFIYQGIAKGIETFTKFAMPALIVIALIVLVRVLTLGTPNPALPEYNINNALGFMWNPKVAQGKSFFKELLNPEMWLAASGQIFFSLSVGFGVIINYASYVRRNDDVLLSGLTSAGMNEFCEVILGGMITLPLAFLFLKTNEMSLGGTLSIGFFTLPLVFHRMWLGAFFGCLWFLMLFIAAITSSLSMLQPAIAFLEEGFGLGRRASVTFLGLIVMLGGLIVIYFSKDLAALDTLDFWVGNFLIFVMALMQTIVFAWIFGVKRGEREMRRGAEIPIPRIYWFVIKWVTPTYLMIIFIGFCIQNLPDRIKAIVASEDRGGILVALALILIVVVAFTLLVQQAGKRWDARRRTEEEL